MVLEDEREVTGIQEDLYNKKLFANDLSSYFPWYHSPTFGLVFLTKLQVADRYVHITTQVKLKAGVMIGQPGVIFDRGTFKGQMHLGNIKAETHLVIIKAETHPGNIKAETHLVIIKAETHLGLAMFAGPSLA